MNATAFGLTKSVLDSDRLRCNNYLVVHWTWEIWDYGDHFQVSQSTPVITQFPKALLSKLSLKAPSGEGDHLGREPCGCTALAELETSKPHLSMVTICMTLKRNQHRGPGWHRKSDIFVTNRLSVNGSNLTFIIYERNKRN